MRKYLTARKRVFVAVLLAVFTLLFSVPNAFARPRGGGFGGGRSMGGFRGGGSIGSSRPSSGGWFSRSSPPSRSTFSTGSSTRTGGFRNGSNIGANTPPRTSSKPWFGSTRSRPATPYYARPSYGGTTIVYNNWRPAYGGNIYVYDHRPWYTPYYMYHAPIYSPQGVLVRQAGFNWGAFFLTLAVVGIGIWLLVRIFSGPRTTKTTTYYN